MNPCLAQLVERMAVDGQMTYADIAQNDFVPAGTVRFPVQVMVLSISTNVGFASLKPTVNLVDYTFEYPGAGMFF